jgi:hopene-associated glycosyltransferase HpnB
VRSWLPAAVAASAWGYLLAGHGRFWRADVRLPEVPPPARWPSVVAIVPARNEAELIGSTVAGLLAQDYPGRLDVVVVDDASTDETAAVACAAGPGGGLTVLRGAARPAGWAGKPWAVHQGLVHASGGLSPQWFLLTDADIHHPPASLRRLVAFGLAERRDLVSLMARLRTETPAERLLVPAFVYFFSMLYPFARVAGRGRTAAAAGGCILVRADALARAGGVRSVRNELIDDVALARRVAATGGSLWLGLADEVRSRRAYPRLGDLWAMVARSADTQLRHSRLLLAGTVCGLGLLYGVPVGSTLLGLARRRAPLSLLGGFAWLLSTVSYLPTVRYHRLHPGWSLTLPVAATLYAGMTVDSALRHRRGRGVTWKGRIYPPQG